MIVGILRLELLLHGPQSLKEKRGLLKKLIARLRNRFPISIAEVDHQDCRQRAALGIVVVGVESAPIERLADRLEEEIARSGLAETGPRQFELLHYSGFDSGWSGGDS